MRGVCIFLASMSLFLTLIFNYPSCAAQTSHSPVISGPIDDANVVVLRGTRHPLAQPQFDAGAVDPNLKMTRVLLVLTSSKEAEADLQAFLDRQQDRTSPDYHHWLTPEEFGERFGPSPQDLATIRAWFGHQGIEVTAIAKSGRWMELSGSSAQMERAFQTQMRQYQIAGETHIANASEISIPVALAPVVRGVASLHSFFKKPMTGRYFKAHSNGDGTYTPIQTDATFSTPNGPVHGLAPGDFHRIYNVIPLFASAIGAGTIGIVARSDVSVSDFNDFRSVTNLSPSTVTNVLTFPPDPGFDPTSGDAVEATLDAQWASAVGPGATVKVFVSASTATSDGVDLSSAYIVDNNAADIMSVSFGECEAGLGSAGNGFYNSLWQQAAAQGISVFVSSGDNGAAGCDPVVDGTPLTHGLAVNGLASTPFNTAVGGTQFNEGANAATFWASTNSPGLISANGYIPEVVWNETCDPTTPSSPCATVGFVRAAGSGGRSSLYSKPSWQGGVPGIPNDAARDLPDISLSAASHDGYVICFAASCSANSVFLVGGTSASSPAMASMFSFIVDVGGRQGLANYRVYKIAANASAFCDSNSRTNPAIGAPAGCVFNDITTGNNSVPGLTGFGATAGYDLGSGLGSVNATGLFRAWPFATLPTPTIALSSNGGTTISAAHGQPVPLSISVTRPSAPAPGGLVSFFAGRTASPAGSVTLTAPANGNVSSFAGNVSNLPGGTYALFAHYPGDAQTGSADSNTVNVTITPESSTATLRTFGIDAQGFAVLTTSFPYGSFMDLHTDVAGTSGQGLATGTVTYQDTTAAVSLGSASVNAKGEAEVFILPNNLVPAPLTVGSHTVTASYGGNSSFNPSVPASVTLTITKGNPAVTVFPEGTYVATQQNFLDVFVVGTGPIGPTGTAQYFDAGSPLGTPQTVSGGQAPISVNFAQEGTHPITVSYSGDATYNATVSKVFNLTVLPPFALIDNNASLTVVAGQTATSNATLTTSVLPSTFSGTVALTCSGAPAGVTCSIAPNSIALSSTTTSVPFTVTVATTTSARINHVPLRGIPAIFAAVVAVLVSLKGRNRRQRWQAMFVVLLILGVSSCGGGGGPQPGPTPPPPPPVTHATLVVTGTSGTHVNTVKVALTITH